MACNFWLNGNILKPQSNMTYHLSFMLFHFVNSDQAKCKRNIHMCSLIWAFWLIWHFLICSLSGQLFVSTDIPEHNAWFRINLILTLRLLSEVHNIQNICKYVNIFLKFQVNFLFMEEKFHLLAYPKQKERNKVTSVWHFA